MGNGIDKTPVIPAHFGNCAGIQRLSLNDAGARANARAPSRGRRIIIRMRFAFS